MRKKSLFRAWPLRAARTADDLLVAAHWCLMVTAILLATATLVEIEIASWSGIEAEPGLQIPLQVAPTSP